jgi:hypothetical protein
MSGASSNPRARLRLGRPAVAVLGGLWVIGLGIGLRSMWTYESRPGAPAHPPERMRAGATTKQARPALIVLAHPRCPCTTATIEELERVMTSAAGKLDARVYFYVPRGAPASWSQTDLWRSAARIPGVQVLADVGGRTAGSFEAKTSGQALLYNAEGRLLFSGGLTDSRGHSGKSAGGAAVLSFLTGGVTEGVTTPVYGCALSSNHVEP